MHIINIIHKKEKRSKKEKTTTAAIDPLKRKAY